LLEYAFLFFLVIDPFGNLPFVLALVGERPRPLYRRIILRETLLAFGVLALFAFTGDRVLGYLHVERASLVVAGGVILFMISLMMIFRSASEMFEDDYAEDPLLFPIAVPSLAGPSAITAVMVVRSQGNATPAGLLAALALVLAFTCVLFLFGQHLHRWLGRRGMNAVEKLMGLLLNLVAVDMMLRGVRAFLST